MMAMSLFAVFWLSFGMLEVPVLGIAASYSSTGSATEGAASLEYNSVVGLYLLVWGFAFMTFFVFACKTNVVFALIFFFAAAAVWVLAGAYFKTGAGNYAMATSLQTVSHPRLLFPLHLVVLDADPMTRLAEPCCSSWLL